MAYDPNDAADKAIVEGLVQERLAEAETEHQAEVTRLKDKNNELLGKLRKAKAGEGGEADAAEIERLERELETNKAELRTAQSELRTANRSLATANTERDTAKTGLEAEQKFSTNLIVENGLTDALIKANVAPQFMDAARAMLAKDATVKIEGDSRNAVVGDKSLVDYVDEWAKSDKGKHFVITPNNVGGNNGITQPANGGIKKISEMNQTERTAHYNAVGEAKFNEQVAAERAAS